MSKKFDGVKLPPTLSETFISFGCAFAFGILGIPSIFELKDVIPLTLGLIFPLKYAMQAYTIFTTLIVGIVWLALFFVLWHRIERCDDNRARLLLTLKWCAIAIAVFLLAFFAHTLLDMRLIGQRARDVA